MKGCDMQMRGTSSMVVAVALLAAAVALQGCGCSDGSLHGDAGTDTDTTDPDGAIDPLDGWDTDEVPDSMTEPDAVEDPAIDYPPLCGDGTLDAGEECDDGNRMDGDGCDWLCRLGDGDPPPEPDPDLPGFEPSGTEVVLPESHLWGWDFGSLPLEWTGSAFATAYNYYDPDAPPPDTGSIRFRKFDTTGATIGPEWTYESPTVIHGHDLVWTGSGFGLFYSTTDAGILFVRLDADGKPLGSPVLVVDDPLAREPAADLADDGFILVWVTDGDPGIHGCVCSDGCPETLRARIVGLDGSTDGRPGPVTVLDNSGGPPAVASGPDGFGLAVMENYTADAACGFRFVRLDPDLGGVTMSGILGPGVGLDVDWAGDGWSTSMMIANVDAYEYVSSELCISRFDGSGALARAPICETVSGDGFVTGGASRIAAGGGGLTILYEEMDSDYMLPGRLEMVSADMSGAAVLPAVLVGTFPEIGGVFNIAWADDGFGVLYKKGDTLSFTWLVPAG